MNLLSEITLKWYDDSTLIREDRRELVEIFLDSLGVSRDVASDIFEVLLLAKSEDVSMTSNQIRDKVLAIREARGREAEASLTLRNVQIWLKWLRDLGMLETLGDRYMFKGNKKPSIVFRESVKPQVIDQSCEYIARLLEKMEERYEIGGKEKHRAKRP